MNGNRFDIVILSVILSISLQAQVEQKESKENDSLMISTTEFVFQNSLFNEWKLLNYPLILNSSTYDYYPHFFLIQNNNLNNNVFNKEEMLAQFRMQQKWETNKKYSSFTEYLGYVQFLGAMGLLGIHISQWSDLKNAPPLTAPAKSFNRYDFKK